MPRLSIVIPCLGGAAEFDGTLVSVLQHRPANCEVLVAHCEPYDDPYALVGEVQFLHRERASVVDLVNAAMEEAAGEIVHVVGCGLEVREDWTKRAVGHFCDPEVAAVAPVVLSEAGNELVSAGVCWTLGGARREVRDRRVLTPGSGRIRAHVVAPSLMAGFYRRDVLAALGGFETRMGDSLADVAFGLSIESLERLTIVEPTSQLVCKQAPRMAPLGRFAIGKAQEQLFRRCGSRDRRALSLMIHPLAAMGEAVRCGSMWPLVGRACAYLDIGAARRYERTLVEAQGRLDVAAEQGAERLVERPMRRAA